MTQPQPTLLILAAGMGSRYGGLKQVDPVGPSGETIMDYSVHDAMAAGFGRVVFVIRRDIEQVFRESVGQRYEGRIAVDYVFQELDALPAGFAVPEGRTRPWGTAHAVAVAAGAIREPFAVINADDFYGPGSFKLLARELSQPAGDDVDDYCMVGFVLDNTLSAHGTVSRGVCRLDENGRLDKVEEHLELRREGGGVRGRDDAGREVELSGREIVSMNMWGFRPSLFGHFERLFSDFLHAHGHEPKSEFYIPTLVDTLIHNGEARVRVLRSEDAWFGVTYPEDKPAVQAGIRRLVEAGTYPERLDLS